MIIEFDNTIALVKPATDKEVEAYNSIRNKTKTLAPGAKYMYQHKLYLKTKGKQGWDGRTSILSKPHDVNKTAFFPTGLLPHVFGELAPLVSTKIQVNDLRAKPKAFLYNIPTVPLRPYQVEAFESATTNNIHLGGTKFHWPCGVLKIPTGGGKTEMAVAMYQATPVPTMFIVHRKHLMTQAIDRFSQYGIQAGQIGDSVFNPNTTGITVATIQTLDNILKAGDMSKINTFIKAQQIFFDECHGLASKIAKGNQFILLSRQFRHAYYRWGLTATPFMKDQYSNQLLMGATGGLLCDINNDLLIKQNYLTPPRVVIIDVPEVKGPQSWPEVYDSAIVLNRSRNLKIIAELAACPKPALVMCNRIGHANILHNLAKEHGIKLPAVQQGSTKNKERNKILKDLQSGKEKAIIATTIFDEGVDLSELRTLILAGAGKSSVAQLQRIGRGLRKAFGKNEVLVIDFNDTTGATLKRHSAARRKVWKSEGFIIEDVKENQ